MIMIDTKNISMESFINNVLENSRSIQERTLMSWTEEIEAAHFTAIFERGLTLKKQRFFWRNSSEDFSFVGIGAVHTIKTEDHRLQLLKEKWEALLLRAMIYNPYEQPGTGLVAVGGMTFDPQKNCSKLWEKFPANQLIVPELLLV